jgi:hypothetical protein
MEGVRGEGYKKRMIAMYSASLKDHDDESDITSDCEHRYVWLRTRTSKIRKPVRKTEEYTNKAGKLQHRKVYTHEDCEVEEDLFFCERCLHTESVTWD